MFCFHQLSWCLSISWTSACIITLKVLNALRKRFNIHLTVCIDHKYQHSQFQNCINVVTTSGKFLEMHDSKLANRDKKIYTSWALFFKTGREECSSVKNGFDDLNFGCVHLLHRNDAIFLLLCVTEFRKVRSGKIGQHQGDPVVYFQCHSTLSPTSSRRLSCPSASWVECCTQPTVPGPNYRCRCCHGNPG